MKMQWKAILLVTGLTVGTLAVSSPMAASGSASSPQRPAAPAAAAAPAAPDEDEVHADAMAEPMAVTSTPELDFVPVQPCRILDTRATVGAFGNGTTRNYFVAGTTGFAPQGGKSGGCNIPVGAKAVTGTLLALTSGGGYVRAWPYGTAAPTASVMAYDKGRASSGFTAPITAGSGRDLTIRNFGGPAHLVVDVTGYYIPKLYAYISSAGAVLDHSGRLVTVSHPATGSYVLTWDRDVSTCSAQANSDVTGYILSTYPSGNSVYVYVDNNAGVAADYYFSIAVHC